MDQNALFGILAEAMNGRAKYRPPMADTPFRRAHPEAVAALNAQRAKGEPLSYAVMSPPAPSPTPTPTPVSAKDRILQGIMAAIGSPQ